MRIPFFPDPLACDPTALTGLLGSILQHTFQQRDVRQRLGWRGISPLLGQAAGWTFTLEGWAGVYALIATGHEVRQGKVSLSYLLAYFPRPDEAQVANLPLASQWHVLQDDYQAHIRECHRDPSLTRCFTIAELSLTFGVATDALLMQVETPGFQCYVSQDGVPAGQEWVVRPGQMEADWALAPMVSTFVSVLSATVARALDIEWTERKVWQCDGLRHCYRQDGSCRQEIDPERPAWRWGFGWLQALAADTRWQVVDAELPAPAAEPEAFLPELWVVGGFLGAGKTSLLNHFIETQNRLGRFVAVIQNELGREDLDRHLLEDDYALEAIDEGCVCCSLTGQLSRALGRIRTSFNPDLVVLETSGVANPANLLTALEDEAALVGKVRVVVVVDADNAMHSLDSYAFAQAQVAAADLLVLNKCDLVDEAALAAIRARLGRLNAAASIESTVHGRIHPAMLEQAGVQAFRGGGIDHRSQLQAISLPLLALDESGAESLCEALAALPEGVVRAKGWASGGQGGGWLIQGVFGRVRLMPQKLDCAPFLVLIGAPDLLAKAHASLAPWLQQTGYRPVAGQRQLTA